MSKKKSFYFVFMFLDACRLSHNLLNTINCCQTQKIMTKISGYNNITGNSTGFVRVSILLVS